MTNKIFRHWESRLLPTPFHLVCGAGSLLHLSIGGSVPGDSGLREPRRQADSSVVIPGASHWGFSSPACPDSAVGPARVTRGRPEGNPIHIWCLPLTIEAP